jgi:hypothetical protein
MEAIKSSIFHKNYNNAKKILARIFQRKSATLKYPAKLSNVESSSLLPPAHHHHA